MTALGFVADDGGRADAGFRGEAGDCSTRAFAIVLGKPYREVYDDLSRMNKEAGGARSAREGVPVRILHTYARENGLDWTPTMGIGTGTSVHLRRDELPSVPLIARVSKHVCAVVDGVIRDTHDPSRGGTRAVYGFCHRPLSEVGGSIETITTTHHEETP